MLALLYTLPVPSAAAAAGAWGCWHNILLLGSDRAAGTAMTAAAAAAGSRHQGSPSAHRSPLRPLLLLLLVCRPWSRSRSSTPVTLLLLAVTIAADSFVHVITIALPVPTLLVMPLPSVLLYVVCHDSA